MKKIVIIPARFDSVRFPGKPLVLINGEPMIIKVLKQVEKAKGIDNLLVATDDNRIAETVASSGFEAIMTSKNHNNGTERIAEVANQFDEEDLIINVQGDEPFINPKSIELISCCENLSEIEIATLVFKSKDQNIFIDQNKVKAVLNIKNEAIYFSRNPIPANAKEFYLHIGMYAFKNKILKQLVNLKPTKLEMSEKLEQLRWLENGFRINTFETKHISKGIDVPEDLI